MTTEASTITTRSGDSLRLNVTAKESDGSALDLTGSTLRFGLSKAPAGETVVLKSSASGSVYITDAISGEFQIEIRPEDTESLSGVYHYEVELTDVNSVVSTVLVGDIMFKADMLT